MIKVLHAADFHLDSPFDALPEEKAAERRREQRAMLDKIASLANREEVDVVLLAGDLLDSDKSYYETGEALKRAFAAMKVPVFIAPGNHDYYHNHAPWAALKLPEHVHIFKTNTPEGIELEGKNAVIWGAAFTANRSHGLLEDFPELQEDKLNLMVLHGQVGSVEEGYNPMLSRQIADTGLDYLALGHEHRYSGLQKAGDTYYAYAGCPEGRGFDELGVGGVIIAEVESGQVKERFVPLGGRQYRKLEVNLENQKDVEQAILEALPLNTSRDIYRIILVGEFNDSIDEADLVKKLSRRFYHLTIQDQTRICRDIWAQREEDSLRGLFLRKMRARYEAGDEAEKEKVTWAIRYALEAMEKGEQWRM